MKTRIFPAVALTLVLTGAAFSHAAQAAPLPPNARVAIIGDSITEQKQYSKFMDAYLLACTGRTDIKCFQFGWSGETAGGFKQRMENDLSVFRPNVATFCYGMNDGGYQPYNENIGKGYEANMRAVLLKAKEMGVTTIVAGTPGAVDTTYFRRATPTPDQYNDTLARLGAIDKKLSEELQTGFADVHGEMINAMAKAKAVLGTDYDVGGRDGVHPGANGQLLMAAAFLKGLGVDGNIGEISVDIKGQGAASAGHRITGANGTVEVESTKWPFCFEGDAKSSGGTRSIVPFTDFNEKLNRLTLRVKNLDAAKAKVTWGTESKEFTKEQLTQGINLAAEFTKTPFDGAFKTFMDAIGAKQNYETTMIKGVITNFRSLTNDAKEDAEFAAALNTLKTKMLAKQESLDAAARKLLVPVKHSLKVEAAQ